MDELAARTGRQYGLVDYHGAPDADRVIVVMGSAAGAVEETVDALVAAGERVGMLPRPPVPAVPRRRDRSPRCRRRVRAIAVLDRTKEPGAVGEPLYLEVVRALAEAMDATRRRSTVPRVIGGRYGLSSKEMTPSMVKPVFDELARRDPEAPLHGRHRRRRHAPQPADRRARSDRRRPARSRPCSSASARDGTVGANKASVKIIGEQTDLFAQGYFVYDSKKSGSVTVSHLRFGPRADPLDLSHRRRPTSSPATSSAARARRGPRVARPGRDVPAQRSVRARRGLGPPAGRGAAAAHRQADRLLGDRRARASPRGRHGQPDQHRHAAVLLRARRASCRPSEAIAADQGLRQKTYAQARRRRRRSATSRRSTARSAPSRTSTSACGRRRPSDCTAACADDAPDFVTAVTALMLAGDGDLLPVSALPVDGTFPTGTAQYEKRAIAQRSRSGTRRSASTAASARWSARTRRSG